MSTSRFSSYQPFFFALVLAFGVFIGVMLGPIMGSKPTPTQARSTYTRMDSILAYIDNRYVDSINTDSLLDVMITNYLNDPATIDSFFKFLDPHSNYIHKEDLQGFNEDLEGNFDGIGIEFNILNDTILVVTALSGGPSEKLGIQSGDQIIRIDDTLVAGIGVTNQQVMSMLRGKKGTVVEVDIKRRGENELIPFRITRDVIPVHSVDVAYMIDDITGYIKVNKFSANTPYEFADAVIKLNSRGMKQLILDLRSNPGGYLQGAVSLADQFIPGKELIVYTEGRAVGRTEERSGKAGLFEQGKLIVLVNEGSASASEILAGALQDNHRATIVGRRSFGKGLVQEVYPLPDTSAVRLTIARYYTPSGKSIQRSYANGTDAYYDEYMQIVMNGDSDSVNGRKADWGIAPDVEVALDTSDLSRRFNRLYNLGLVQQFSYGWYGNHKKQMEGYADVQAFQKDFHMSDEMFRSFLNYVSDKEPEQSLPADTASLLRPRIETGIMAVLARQQWGNDGFFPILNSMDPDIQAALDAAYRKEEHKK